MLRERRRAVNNKPNRRLDRKSSRGMIYENEELRLRTININAEVERGQSDIRKLRRENEQLRREIWALRDEYDRLDKLLTAHSKNSNNNNNSESYSGTSGSESNLSTGSENSFDENELIHEDLNENEKTKDETQKCKNCQCDVKKSNGVSPTTIDNETVDNKKNLQKSLNGNSSNFSTKNKENLHVNFDHLSIVSEENLTLNNSNQNSPRSPNSPNSPNSPVSPHSPSSRNSINETIHSVMEQESILRSMSPINELQSIQPTLYHFENLSYESLGPSIDSNGRLLRKIEKPEPLKPKPPPLKVKPHFFAPLRLKPSAPEWLKKEPVYATINQTNKLTASSSSFQNGGNLDDLLKDLSLDNTEDLYNNDHQPDIIAIQGSVLPDQPTTIHTQTTEQVSSNPKKHRSQINLVLNYNNNHDNEPERTIDHLLDRTAGKIGFENFDNKNKKIESEPIYSTVEKSTTPPLPPQLSNGIIFYRKDKSRTPELQPIKTPPIIDLRRKAHRVSLSFSRKNTNDLHSRGRRASIDVISVEKNGSELIPSLFRRRHSTHTHHLHSIFGSNNFKSLQAAPSISSLKNHSKQLIRDETTITTENVVTEKINNRHSSSRDSTSSVNTQKSRKASLSSTGGKIPWCGCWGNGCF